MPTLSFIVLYFYKDGKNVDCRDIPGNKTGIACRRHGLQSAPEMIIFSCLIIYPEKQKKRPALARRGICASSQGGIAVKKVISVVLLVFLLLSSVACAEEVNYEKQAELIFQNLNVLYEETYRYLEQMKDVWNAIIQDGKSEIDKEWFDTHVLDTANSSGRYSDILTWENHNGYTLEEFYNTYDTFFVPLKELCGNDRDACLLFIRLVYKDESAAEKLLPFKDKIIDLKVAYPDYEYLKEIQNFYRKTSEMVDYANGSFENYLSFSEKVSSFDEARISIKSDFIFAYEWIDWVYFAMDMNEEYKAFLTQYHEKRLMAEALEKQPLYDKAVKLEQEGKKAEANGLYAALGNYLDSAEKFNAHYCSNTTTTVLRSGLAPVKYGDYYVFLTKYGKPMFAGEWDWVGNASNGMFAVMKDQKRGYIDINGEIAVPLVWDSTMEFSKDGKAFVYSQADGYWSEIDKTGKVLRNKLGNPVTSTADQAEGGWIPFKNWYTDNTGKAALIGEWDRGYDFYSEYAVVSKDGKCGLIDRKGNYIYPCEYDTILNGGSFFVLVKNGYLSIEDDSKNVLY